MAKRNESKIKHIILLATTLDAKTKLLADELRAFLNARNFAVKVSLISAKHQLENVADIEPCTLILMANLDNAPQQSLFEPTKAFNIKILKHPNINEHTSFEPLKSHHVALSYLDTCNSAQDALAADLIILPGSKNVRQDLSCLQKQGWDRHILRHLRYGGKLLGIGGGYQMLGLEVDDPCGIEGEAGVSDGLGLLPIVTELKPIQQVHHVHGYLQLGKDRVTVTGNEIHYGESHRLRTTAIPFSWQRNKQASGTVATTTALNVQDGSLSDDDQILGTYLHGLFDSVQATEQILNWAGIKQKAETSKALFETQGTERSNILTQSIDLEALTTILSKH